MRSMIRPLRALLPLALLVTPACGAMVTPGHEDVVVDNPGDAPRPDVNTGDATDTWVEGPDVQPDVPTTCSFEGASNVRISYVGPNSTPLDCSGPRPTPGGGSNEIITRTAAIVSVADDAEGTHLALDFCSPAADCVPMLGTLTINAPEFTLANANPAPRPGQFVRIRSRASWSWACTMEVEIANAPSWDGVMNPMRNDDAILAAAAYGVPSSLEQPLFGVERTSIGCATGGPNCGGGAPELFALSFQGTCRTCIRNPDPVLVRQGQSSTMQIDSNTYLVRNHRSFNTGACDDYWNYAWTMREIWLE